LRKAQRRRSYFSKVQDKKEKAKMRGGMKEHKENLNF